MNGFIVFDQNLENCAELCGLHPLLRLPGGDVGVSKDDLSRGNHRTLRHLPFDDSGGLILLWKLHLELGHPGSP